MSVYIDLEDVTPYQGLVRDESRRGMQWTVYDDENMRTYALGESIPATWADAVKAINCDVMPSIPSDWCWEEQIREDGRVTINGVDVAVTVATDDDGCLVLALAEEQEALI